MPLTKLTSGGIHAISVELHRQKYPLIPPYVPYYATRRLFSVENVEKLVACPIRLHEVCKMASTDIPKLGSSCNHLVEL